MITTSFSKHVQLAIALMTNAGSKSSDESLLEIFQKQGIGRTEAVELLLFLPVAFCRTLVNKVEWDDVYSVLNADKTISAMKFSETVSYQIILEETERYFLQQPTAQQVLAIAGRSAEFQVLNDLLLKNSRLKPEEIRFSRLVVMR